MVELTLDKGINAYQFVDELRAQGVDVLGKIHVATGKVIIHVHDGHQAVIDAAWATHAPTYESSHDSLRAEEFRMTNLVGAPV